MITNYYNYLNKKSYTNLLKIKLQKKNEKNISKECNNYYYKFSLKNCKLDWRKENKKKTIFIKMKNLK